VGKVITELSVSLDGFVAGPNDSPELPLGEGGAKLFEWYYSGDTPLPLAGTDMVFKVSLARAELLREDWDATGAIVAGSGCSTTWARHPSNWNAQGCGGPRRNPSPISGAEGGYGGGGIGRA
jgi:hypothetical protein